MRILYVSQYFPPEMGAPAARVHEMSRAWARRGARVTVLTAMPHHPTGVVPRRYRRKRLLREERDGIRVVRTWIWPAANRGFVKRTTSYLTFMASAIVSGLTAVRKHDVVIASSPQFFVGIAGWALAKLGRGKFVFEVRDLWPDSLLAVGAMREGPAFRMLKRVERFLYREAWKIVVVTESSGRILSESGIGEEKIEVVTNGVDLETFHPGEDEETRRGLGLAGRFVVSYVGTIGLAHGLEVILRAAEKLRQAPEIVFIVVGEGAERERIEREKEGMGLRNVLFTGEVPRERIPGILRASDACLVHLKRAKLFETVIPSKIFEIMGCGKPILMGVRGEARRLVEEAGAGVLFESEDEDGLVAAIQKLRSDKGLARRLGAGGRAFVEARYSREAMAERFLSFLAQGGTR
ncbi:MAG: glycosyltransferase family 4 protein [Planctomycetota bacterium]